MTDVAFQGGSFQPDAFQVGGITSIPIIVVTPQIGVARVFDRTFGICYGHKRPIQIGGTIITGDPTVTSNNLPIARIGSIVMADCGHTAMIVTGSPTTLATNITFARLGDQTSGIYVASIITSSVDVTTS